MYSIMEVLVVKELEQIKALSSSYRIEVLEAFDNKPATAKQISTRLGEPHGKVNYHMKTLAKVGILRLVETSTKLGVVEKFYMPVAKNFIIDSKALRNEGEEFDSSVSKYIGAIFDRLSKDFAKSMSNGKITHSQKMFYVGDVHLTLEEAEELEAKIQSVITEYTDDKKTTRENTERYSVTSLLIPVDTN